MIRKQIEQTQAQMLAAKSDSVAWTKPEVREIIPIYQIISDALEGEYIVKNKKTKYLPDPSGVRCQPLERERRYAQYLNNAIFVNYARKTLGSLSGLAFQNPPKLEIPLELEEMVQNISGTGGQTLQVQSKEALEYVLAFGRCGILVDFPEGFSEGNPTLTLYAPWDIINFRVEDIGAEERLTLLVLREFHSVKTGMYSEEEAECFREFRLTPEGVKHILHVPKESGLEPVSDLLLRDASGKPLESIPFCFANDTGNEAERIVIPEFYGLVSLNLAHYRAFADYQEMCHLLAQQSLSISGLTDSWIDNHLQNGFEFGTRNALLLPEGAVASVISANSSGLNIENVRKIEEELLKIGARIAEKRSVRTATEAEIENVSETSSLISAVTSVSLAYTAALRIACDYAGLDSTKVSYAISTNYDLTTFKISDAQSIGHLFALGALTMQELRDALLKIGLASASFEEFEAEKVNDSDRLDELVFESEEEEVEEEEAEEEQK